MRIEKYRFALSIAFCLGVLLLTVLLAPTAQAAQHAENVDNPYPCAAQESWVTSPNPPQEIPDNGSDFCDFYQFAWQWFLYLGSPGDDGRNFQDTAAFPEWEYPADSCDGQSEGHSLFIRDVKGDDEDEASDVMIPDRTGQAGGGAVIYDQNKNVVYYNVQFDQGLCDAGTSGNLPAGTTEMKTSWRLMDGDDDTYFTWTVSIDGVNGGDPVDLGLVGFHLFRTTAQHPEGVWMTWEHESNAPTCTHPQPAPAGGWSFTSAECAACLAGGGDCTSCQFNVADAKGDDPDPTEICQVYRNGTKKGDLKAEENLIVVNELNRQLVGPDGFLGSLDPSNAMAVWAHYPMVGGLWVSDPSKPAADSNGNDNGNQRGSLQLANTTMETTHQGGPNSSPMLNCFTCHDYQPNETATSGLSHIFGEIHGSSSDSAKSAHRGAHDLTFVKAHRPAPEAGADRE